MDAVFELDDEGRMVLPGEWRARHHLASGSRVRVTERGMHLEIEPLPATGWLAERHGLLVATAPLRGPVTDHRDLRNERLEHLGGEK